MTEGENVEGPVRRVVVIDDDPHYSTLLSVYLTEKGYEVFCSGNGAAGLECVREKKPDAILTDVTMPEASGLELVRSLQEDPGLKAIPILVLTGNRFTDSVRCLFEQETNVLGFFEKTEELARIEERLEKILRKKSSA